MNVLHICNGYAGSKVHCHLAKSLDNLGVIQTVYCPVREEKSIGCNKFEGKNIDFVYSFCIKPWYKYVYQFKSWILYRDMRNRIELNKFDIIHAPTLFSDGGLALKAYKEFGIPYVVAVRSTDLNIFIKKLKHTHYVGREILLCAKKIYFLSKTCMDEFINSNFVRPILPRILDKIVFQPNGIDNYWLQHINYEQRVGHKVLYVGTFLQRKNIARLVDAIIKLRKNEVYADLKLLIVGGGNEKGSSITNLIKSHPDFIEYLGKIYDKEMVVKIMRDCSLFAMPSIHETFGLVYIEALTQNLPIIYSKGEGVDGIFDETVGERVDPLAIDDICKALQRVLASPEKYGNMHVDFDMFNWNNIANQYLAHYIDIIGTVDTTITKMQ